MYFLKLSYNMKCGMVFFFFVVVNGVKCVVVLVILLIEICIEYYLN